VTAAAAIDGEGLVVGWSQTAAELVGRTAAEVCGLPVRELLADGSCHELPADGPCRESGADGTGMPAGGRARLRHASGGTVEVAFQVLPMEVAGGYLVLAVPAARAAEWGQGVSLLRALFTQDRLGIGIHDTELNFLRTNITPEMFGGPPLPAPGARMRTAMPAAHSAAVEAVLRQAMETGVPVIDWEHRLPLPPTAGRQQFMSLSAFGMADAAGDPSGVAVLVHDITEQRRIRSHLDLLHRCADRIGSSLDVVRTAQELAGVLVPALGDLVTVDLAESVLVGDEPAEILVGGQPHLARAATASATGGWPAEVLGPGTTYPVLADSPELRRLQQGQTVVLDRAGVIRALGDPRAVGMLVPDLAHSVLVAPLLARGRTLGTISLWRTDQPGPFDESERALLAEIASRAALGVDNARRYTHEHRAAVALQERLLPRAVTDTPAVETAGIYRPAGGGADISGDWFDVIRLPSLRVALVIGDVIGHGLPATATMGRLRTAIQTFADLELDPTEVLIRVDDLVQRLAAEAPNGQADTVGATCLYAVYDPITRRCTLASAGQPPPVVVEPDGTTRFIEVSPGPPLGVGGVPFESTTVELEPGSVLALYTDGLFALEDFDVERGLRRIRAELASRCRPGRALDEVGHALFAGLGDDAPHDDVALLLARTRAVSPSNTASWQFPATAASVADAREVTVRQLAKWGLDELALTTELVVSELVTNAIRYAGGPVGMRLIRDKVLICEVADPSNTQPRLVRAGDTDEGGRGLFIVAQCTTRWGSRYGQRGKTIWTEQSLGGRTAPLFTPV
ncbi:MAG: hypothetical protein QOF98_1882, partial [Streptomyces sp.]|nr:hypothetical protein [Streptomyces sp.]